MTGLEKEQVGGAYFYDRHGQGAGMVILELIHLILTYDTDLPSGDQHLVQQRTRRLQKPPYILRGCCLPRITGAGDKTRTYDLMITNSI